MVTDVEDDGEGMFFKGDQSTKCICPERPCHPDPFGKAQGKVPRRISLSRGVYRLGTDSSAWPQNDNADREQLGDVEDFGDGPGLGDAAMWSE